MNRILLTTLFTAITATTAFADPGHLAAAGHGHSHIAAYAILFGIAAIGAGVAIARAKTAKA